MNAKKLEIKAIATAATISAVNRFLKNEDQKLAAMMILSVKGREATKVLFNFWIKPQLDTYIMEMESK